MPSGTIDITFVLRIRLLPDDSAEKKFVFDTGVQGSTKDKWSLFTEGDLLVFSSTDLNSQEHRAIASTTGLIDNFCTLFLEIESSQESTSIRISSDLELLAETKTGAPTLHSQHPFQTNFFLGSDVMGHNHRDFDMMAQYIYGTILADDDKGKLLDYIRKQSIPGVSITRFINGAYLYRHGDQRDLMQPAEANRPKLAKLVDDV